MNSLQEIIVKILTTTEFQMAVKALKKESIIFTALFNACGDFHITRHKPCCSKTTLYLPLTFGDAYNPQTIQINAMH